MFFFPSSEVLIVIKIVTLQRETPLISVLGPDHIERGKYKKKKKEKTYYDSPSWLVWTKKFQRP